jgi:hypothetical protein
MREQALIVSVILVILFWAVYAFSADTTIKYSGMPVPSAMSPSISAFSNDMCKSGVSGGANTGVISISGGATVTDENCERIKLSKVLNDLGLKVAAVGVLCQDERVFEAMLQAGSACPINGAVGDAALRAWYELKTRSVCEVVWQELDSSYCHLSYGVMYMRGIVTFLKQAMAGI